jgi:hypothetical protein
MNSKKYKKLFKTKHSHPLHYTAILLSVGYLFIFLAAQISQTAVVEQVYADTGTIVTGN